MFRSFLSWRYMLRRRTNLIGIVGILVGVAALITILSIMTGFLELSRQTMRGSLSDLILTPYFGSREVDGSIPAEPGPLVEALLADERVEAVSPHLVWFCMVVRDGADGVPMLSSSRRGQYAGVKLIGVDLEQEYQATELREALVREPHRGAQVLDPDQPFAAPPNAPPGRPRPSAIVGEQLYYAHGLHRGAVINVATAVPGGPGEDLKISNREFVVAGTFRSTDNELDLERIYVERDQLARFISGVEVEDPLPEHALRYSEVLIKVRDYERDKDVLQVELRDMLVAAGLLHPFSELRTWEDYRGPLLAAIRNERVLMGIMLSLVLLVASFTIFAILSMMVNEKRRDIGILTAVGATPRGVLSLFLMIAFWDALLGCLLGTGIGVFLALEIDAIERALSSSFGIQIFDRNVYAFDYIPSVVQPMAVLAIVAGAFISTLLFALVPAWKASRLDPLDALRYE